MSRDSGDYYKYDRNRRSPQRSLPPIRDVVGDVLEQPATPRPMPNSYDTHTPRRQTYPACSQSRRNTNPNQQQQPHLVVQLPPIRSRSAEYAPSKSMATSGAPWGNSCAESSRAQPPSSENAYKNSRRSEGTSTHSYDVFQIASGQGLVHQRRSSKDDFRQSSKEEAISTSTGRHVCPECSRRFEKLSHFKNHLTSHSGEKPYECPQCGKTFSASSNMRRHQRTHGPAGEYQNA